MNNIALKPQLNVLNSQKDLLSKSAAASANKSSEAAASFGSVLKEKQSPSQSDASLKSDRNLNKNVGRDVNHDKKTATRETENASSETQSRQAESSNGSPEPVKAQKAQGAINEQDAASTEAATREKVMSAFLDRMQSELGIEPEQFVEAFSKLEISDLALPPEETIEKVIASLDLNEAQKLVAENLYSEMLVMSAAANMSQYLKDNSQTANVEVLTPEQASKKQLQRNIDEMNSQFFVNNQQVKELSQLKKMQGQQAYTSKDGSALVAAPLASETGQFGTMGETAASANMSNAPINASAPKIDLSGLGLEDQALSAEAESAVQDLQNKIAEMSLQAPGDSALAPDMALAPDVALDQGGYVAKEMAVDMNLGSSSLTAAGADSDSAISALGQSDSTSFGFGSNSGAESEDTSAGNELDAADPSAFSLNQAGKAVKGSQQFAVEAPKATTAQVQGNIQEVISQAQFLARKGGGEMNVQMSPEGMGDLKLKVAVVDGQVSVEMVASNNEAKKLIEKGMNDLKASLAGQKLHVDQIKIDATPESSNQMNQNNGQEQAGRQYQQRFLQDFRDGNSGFRREFFEFGPAATPGSQLRDRASNSVYDPTARKKSSDRRLDVVA